jgi:hypothetical protein
VQEITDSPAAGSEMVDDASPSIRRKSIDTIRSRAESVRKFAHIIAISAEGLGNV